MKKIITLLLMATIGLAACSSSDENDKANETSQIKKATTSEVLKFGTLPAESAIPIILAKKNGYFDEEQVNIQLTPFSSPNDRNVAAQSGELDGMIGDVMTALSFREGGMNLIITSDINEEFKLLSSPNSGITEIKQLNGKDVSLVPKFLLEYLMDEMASENDITYEVVSIPSIPARYEALLGDQIDSVIFTEPQATLLEKKGAHVLASSSEYGIKGGTILFSEASVKNQPSDIAAFYRAYNKAIDYMNETDASHYSATLKEYNFPEAMEDYLVNKKDSYTKASVVSKKQYDSIEKWTKAKEMIYQEYSYEKLTDFSMLEN